MLSILIWLPICVGLFILSLGKEKAKLAKLVSAIVILTLTLSIVIYSWLFLHFDPKFFDMQFQEVVPWIGKFNINYALGIDGLSLIFIGLTIVIGLVVILYKSENAVSPLRFQQLGIILLTQGLLIGIFAATDALLFYIFWEAILIPLFMLIGIWGKENRSYAAIKFFLFTFLGSIFLLIALGYFYNLTHSFNIADFYNLPLSLPIQIAIFLAFFLAFAIKVPMWPLHNWLPDAHSQAPTIGSVILAAILLKVGAYGFIRFSLPIAADGAHYLAWPMVILSLIAIVYIGFIALCQQDIKRMIAYSSIAHMGVVTLGIFASLLLVQNKNLATMCLDGAIIQMVSHALSIGGLFLCIGILYKRLPSTAIKDFQGVAHEMPILAVFFMFFILATIGFPGTSGFVGEFLIILSTYQISIWVALICGSTLVIGAGYMLWLFQRIFWGSIAKGQTKSLVDINWFECLPLLILTVLILIIGLYPQIIKIISF
jgi:NADH-quinone oxidoreductase subunit M